MKIVLVSEHASPLARIGGVDAGGQNIYVAQVARCLSQAGHQVEVLTRRDDPSLPEVVILGCGTRVVHIDAGPPTFVAKEALLPWMDEFTARSAKYLRSTEPGLGRRDIVHANFFMSGLVADNLKRALGLPYVITFHALGLVRLQHQKQADGFPAERMQIERMLVQRADQVIAECPQDKADIMNLYGGSRHRMVTVPCGFDANEFGPMERSDARQQLGLSPDEFIVLQLGRLVPRKGIDNVIRAVGLLPQDVPARLLVVGGDAATADAMTNGAAQELQRLRHVAAECGATGRVTFIGHRQRNDLKSFYGASDVFATTPWYEPFGITPLEAMACGRAVVGSHVGGIKHSVVDGETGLLVPPHDPGALADTFMRLYREPALKDAMGLAGLQRASSRFTWQQVSNRLLEVYERVVHAKGQPHLVSDQSEALAAPASSSFDFADLRAAA